MAAQDLRSAFRDVTVADPDMQTIYRRFGGATLDTGTGVKTIANIPKGARVVDCKSTVVTALTGTAYTFDIETNDGTTTTTLISGQTSTAVNTARITGTTSGDALMAAAATVRLNCTTATSVTTPPVVLVSITFVREVAN
jgi:hypothetical protein